MSLLKKRELWGGFIASLQYSGSFSSYLYEIRYIILFYVIGDWASTVYALPLGTEYNPVPAMILEYYGIYHLLLVKVGFIFLLFLCGSSDKNIKQKMDLYKTYYRICRYLCNCNNLMVVWYGNSLIQALGLVWLN